MRKLEILLTCTTLAFAGSTLYFRSELESERAAHPATASAVPPAPAAAVATAPSPKTSTPGAAEIVRMNAGFSAQTIPAGSSPANPPLSRDAAFLEARRRAVQEAPAFLARYNSAQGRAELVKEYRRLFQAFTVAHPADLGLDDETYERFMNTLAENGLAAREEVYRCALDERCRFPGMDPSSLDARRRDLISMFGAGVIEKFEFLESSGGELRVVRELRGRLPDSARMTDAQSDALVHALYDENRSIQGEIAKLGGDIGSYNQIVYAQMGPDGATAMNDSARAFNARLEHRAAGILTREQLRMYLAMQNEAVGQIESRNRGD